MGGGNSTKKLLLPNTDEFDDRYFGLENFGNTCYINSVLQCLYFCEPFRRELLRSAATATATASSASAKASASASASASAATGEASLMASLAALFVTISRQKRRSGSLAPRQFVAHLKRENALFRGANQQDAHEFLNYLLNAAVTSAGAAGVAGVAGGKEGKEGNEGKEGEEREEGEEGEEGMEEEDGSEEKEGGECTEGRTWLHRVFGGVLTNQTRCLSCETLTFRDERFLDLSLEVAPNISLKVGRKNRDREETEK